MTAPRVVSSRPAPGENWYTDDPALRNLLRRYAPPGTLDAAEPRLTALGALAPSELDAHARAADRHRPVLVERTPEGESLNDVRFDPSYRELQRAAREHGIFTAAWHPLGDAPTAPRVVGFALGYLFAQAECGYYCPACMTDGAAFVLARHAPAAIRDAFVPRLVSKRAENGIEGAMYLTEKGGGSDVGTGTETRATPHADGTWRLTGEKWFASNCVAEATLALARMPSGEPGTKGLGLFLVPRHLADGRRNPGVRIVRLKEKLGVTSMPTGEVLLQDAVAHLVAGEGAGFKIMAEMVNLSRLYNAVASVALARRALREGERAGRERVVFGRALKDQPLHQRAITALATEVEGALAFTLETAHVFDAHARGDAAAGKRLRLLTPAAKAMTAKLAVRAASEACEFLGGVGYIEEYVTPRLLRDAQVLPIWEGTTTIQHLEFLRALETPGALASFRDATLDRLAAARTEARLGPAVAAAEVALATFERDALALGRLERPARELAAPRLMARAYHTLATALLAWAASDANEPRAAEVANLYAALHLAANAEEAERALAHALLDKDQDA